MLGLFNSKKGFIIDEDGVRNCNFNRARMSLLESIVFDFMYLRFFNSIVSGLFEQLVEGLKYLGAFVINLLLTIFFPITLPVSAYFKIKRAKQECLNNERFFGKK